MSYNIIPIEKFKKDAKRLIRKYPSLKNELIELYPLLQKNPTAGTSLGHNTFKLRIAIRSKSVGKSGGARIITYVVTENKEIYLLTIYDKADLDSIDNTTLRKIVKSIKTGQ